MRRLVIIATALASLALAGSAAAHTMPGEHHCRPATPGFTRMLTAWAPATCAQARAVERYWVSHETEGQRFRVAGIRWRQTTYPTASPNWQATILTGPHGREIDVVHRPSN